MSGTAQTYITQAFLNLNVFQPGITLPPAIAADALTRLNLMMSTWSQQLEAYAIITQAVPLVANKRVYTWGLPGGDIATPKPSNQNSLQQATLQLGGTTPVVEVPLAILTDDMYAAIQVKTLPSMQPTAVYYSPLVPLAFVTLWPVPNNSLHTLVIFFETTFGPFADLNTTIYTFPDGYDEAIVYNLERRLAGPYGRELPPDDALLARETFANIFRSNVRLSDLPSDFATAFGSRHRHGYNIESGTGGGS
jgi:hypothetical protein